MEKMIIQGGVKLKGEVDISGAKNAALGILPATILCQDECVIENLPNINDIKNYITILEKLGAKIEKKEHGVSINTKSITNRQDEEIDKAITKMRASYYLLGAMLGRFGKTRIPLPGGCNIGTRPIDQHIKGFEALGATIENKYGYIDIEAKKLTGANIYMDVVSVGATINIMLAAVLAQGITTIENAAKEPHVVDVANFLAHMGANIKGAGTDIIKITGVDKLHGSTYMVIPDQITAGTYMIAAAATKGNVLVKNIIPKHMEPISAKLIEMGVDIIEYDDAIRVIGSNKYNPINIKTRPYPGFPTDLQQPFAVLMCLADGVSSIHETIYENRFRYLSELERMGADIRISGRTAIITGESKLYGTSIRATDLRAGAAMIVAGLIAKGTTIVTELTHIRRGYEDIEKKLVNLGAKIHTEDN